MKTVRTIAWSLILIATIAGCATQQKTQSNINSLPENERPDFKTSADGTIHAELLAGKRVYASFRNSEKLTKVLVSFVEKAGGKAVSDADQADLTLDARGEFLAIREFGARRARADIGEAFEKSGEVSSIDRNVRIEISPGGALLNAAQASALATGMGAIADITGFRGWFNNLVAGDPDGICFNGCEYRQAVGIEAILKDRDGKTLGETRITSRTEHKKLWPVPLTDAALNEFFALFVRPRTEQD